MRRHGEGREVNKWSNGVWTIEQLDDDTVRITGPYNQVCLIHGGDFESVLSGLCAAYHNGKRVEK